MEFEDILYEKRDGIARITFNRPKLYNAVRPQTIEELLKALRTCPSFNPGIADTGHMVNCWSISIMSFSWNSTLSLGNRS